MIGIFLDIESNGLDVMKHRVLEIAFKFICLTSKKEFATYSSTVHQPRSVWEKSDPLSLEVNGFTFEMLETAKRESEVAEEIIKLFDEHQVDREHAVYICQNPSFDRSFFSQLIASEVQEKNRWPYHWLDLASMYWALALQKYHKGLGPAPWETGISKNKIAVQYQLPEERHPHKALQGVEHLIDCYFAIHALDTHSESQRNH